MFSGTHSDTHSDESFPIRQILVLGTCRLVEPIAYTSVMSYSVIMVQDLRGHENASLYAGLLISAFAMAEGCGATFWGALSDRYGRKRIVLIGLMGTLLSCLLLGFVQSYWMAFAARLAGGLLNGNVAVIQTMVTEIVHNPKHEPIAYAMHPLTWNLGSILGSALGGYTARPASYYPQIFSQDGIFGKYPYLLPNLVCVVLIAFAILQCLLLLQEPKSSAHVTAVSQSTLHNGVDERTPLRARITQTSLSTAISTRFKQPAFTATSLPNPIDPLLENSRSSIDTFRQASLKTALVSDDHPKDASMLKLNNPNQSTKVFNNDVLMWILSIALLCYHLLAFTSILPLYIIDTPRRTHGLDLHGGLGLSVHEVGDILAANSLWCLFIQIAVFPVLMAKAGVWKCVVWCTILTPLADIAVPFASATSNPLSLLYASFALRTFFYMMIYPGQLIMLKNAASSTAVLGRINGLTVTTASMGRTVAPPLAGLIYDALGSAAAWWSCAAFSVLSITQLAFLRKLKG